VDSIVVVDRAQGYFTHWFLEPLTKNNSDGVTLEEILRKTQQELCKYDLRDPTTGKCVDQTPQLSSNRALNDPSRKFDLEPTPGGRKRALLIGVDYTDTDRALVSFT